MGSIYCFYLPNTLESNIKTYFNIDKSKYQLLFSVYEFPNLIVPFIGGMIVDRTGVRISMIIVICIMICGQVLIISSVCSAHFWLMIMGRLIFGLGAEILHLS